MTEGHEGEPSEAAGTAAAGSAWIHERELVAALRAGDEDAFRTLVRSHTAAMIHVASGYVPSRAIAEEVVQETWLAIVQGLDRFEGRSSLKTWMYRILINRARTRGVAEHRTVPVSALHHDNDPAGAGDRFFERGHRWAGHWADPPQPWSDVPSEGVLHDETRRVVEGTISVMVPAQRDVIRLRDIEGWTAEEVCDAMGLSQVNQRVLLHRARTKVRAALERHLSAADIAMGTV